MMRIPVFPLFVCVFGIIMVVVGMTNHPTYDKEIHWYGGLCS